MIKWFKRMILTLLMSKEERVVIWNAIVYSEKKFEKRGKTREFAIVWRVAERVRYLFFSKKEFEYLQTQQNLDWLHENIENVIYETYMQGREDFANELKRFGIHAVKPQKCNWAERYSKKDLENILNSKTKTDNFEKTDDDEKPFDEKAKEELLKNTDLSEQDGDKFDDTELTIWGIPFTMSVKIYEAVENKNQEGVETTGDGEKELTDEERSEGADDNQSEDEKELAPETVDESVAAESTSLPDKDVKTKKNGKK